MMQTLPDRAAGPLADGTLLLDAERLDAYRVAREFYALACTFPLRSEGELRDQLRRAALSIPLNIAEGVGRARDSADRARFYSIARGSAMECAAILDIIDIRALAPAPDVRRGRGLLVRIVQMLSSLIAVCR